MTISFYIIFIYRGSLFSMFTTLIYHKVLINNKTEQDTEQDTTYRLLPLSLRNDYHTTTTISLLRLYHYNVYLNNTTIALLRLSHY